MQNFNAKPFILINFLPLLLIFSSCAVKENLQPQVLNIYNENPFYWEYKEKPILLLGGTDQDNLFNHPNIPPAGLREHLDLLVKSGGNYVRNTMSHRDSGNVFAFDQVNGKFDLTRWNEEYWNLFESFLKMTFERDIIVQLELWETWDFYVERLEQGGWSKHPFNPHNNINYTLEESNLSEEIEFYPVDIPTSHNFFHTVPALENNTVVLSWQQAFVDKILSYSLNYPNILYCINNETGEPPEWGEYWVKYIRARADEKNISIHVTDMRRSEDISSATHRKIQNSPELYSFLEISQNNGHSQTGQVHYNQILKLRSYLSSKPRPMNNVKVYGGEGGFGGAEEGIRKFWRNIFAGSAAIRFHRRTFHGAGLGLSESAQIHLRSARDVTDEFNIFLSEPRNDLISNRYPDSSYCLARIGEQYLIFFPKSAEILLDVSGAKNNLTIKWYNILKNHWTESETVENKGTLILKTPAEGLWAVLVTSN